MPLVAYKNCLVCYLTPVLANALQKHNYVYGKYTFIYYNYFVRSYYQKNEKLFSTSNHQKGSRTYYPPK